MFKKIRTSLQPRESSGISRIDVPADLVPFLLDGSVSETSPIHHTNNKLTEILQRTVRIKRKDGPEEWVTLIDKSQMETALLLYCQEHFFNKQKRLHLDLDPLQN
jgi:hypothetical protein